MNHDEATDYFDSLGERVEARAPLTPELINLGRVATRRRTRRTLVGVVASVALILGGGAVIQQAIGGGSTAPATAVSELPTAPDGMRLVGVGSVVVAVPDSFEVSDACGRPAWSDAIELYVSTPCEGRGDGEHFAMWFVDANSPLANLSALVGMESIDVNGIGTVQGDFACPPNANCTFGSAHVLRIPGQDVALLWVANDVRSPLMQETIQSLRLLAPDLTTIPYVAPGTPFGQARQALTTAGFKVSLVANGLGPADNIPVRLTSHEPGVVVGLNTPVTLEPVGIIDRGAEQTPMTASPTIARPGEIVSLHFPTEQGRGIAFTLTPALNCLSAECSSSRPFSFDPGTFHLTSDGASKDRQPSWSAKNRRTIDIGVGGPGPDHVVIPEIAAPGAYTLCTANAAKQMCVDLTVAGEPIAE